MERKHPTEFDEVKQLDQLIGKTLVAADGEKEGDELIFVASDLSRYRFYHDQDCCESVSIESIDGDLDDLLGSPIVMAEECTHSEDDGHCDSFTWTFYKFATAKGYVTVRWFGESNGYYSESVSMDVSKVVPEEVK